MGGIRYWGAIMSCCACAGSGGGLAVLVAMVVLEVVLDEVVAGKGFDPSQYP